MSHGTGTIGVLRGFVSRPLPGTAEGRLSQVHPEISEVHALASVPFTDDKKTATRSYGVHMHSGKRILAAGLVVTACASALTVAGVAVPAQAAAQGTVDCDGWVHNNDPDVGIAGCQNNSDHTVTFRAEIVCGRAPDVSGNWVTLNPGQYGESTGSCAFYSTGVGSVGWTIQ